MLNRKMASQYDEATARHNLALDPNTCLGLLYASPHGFRLHQQPLSKC